MIDEIKAKWYGIIGVFFCVLVSSVLTTWFFTNYLIKGEWNNEYLWKYYDVFIPILAFVAYKSAKNVGKNIIFLRKPPFGEIFSALTKTTMKTYWITYFGLIFYRLPFDNGVIAVLNDFSKSVSIFIWLFILGSIAVFLANIIPMAISAKILGKFLQRYKT